MTPGAILVGQSGGPTAVINASLAGVIRASRRSNKGTRVYGMRFGIEGFLAGETLDIGDLRDDAIDLLARTPSSALGSCRYKLTDADLPRVRDRLARLGIRVVLSIGGNDTMDTIHRLGDYCRSSGYDLAAIGIPKTVDNDLCATDHTPGYPSAARYVALSVQQGGRLARDMQRVDRFTIFQTVGRDTGWLAAAAALARRFTGDPPHLIYLPERPITPEQVVKEARAVIEHHRWCSIVVGEGVRWVDGTPVSASSMKDEFDNVQYGAMGGSSAAMVLHRIIADATGMTGEFQVTESLAMAASDRVSSRDRTEAGACGEAAVFRALDGETGVMITIDRSDDDVTTYGTVPLAEVAAKTKPLPDRYVNGSDVTPEFLNYVRPLVGPLPEYFSF